MLGMTSTSSWEWYVTFKSIFVIWAIPKHDLKKGLKFLLGMKTTSSEVYNVTFESIFLCWDILKHDLEKGWNFCFAWKLHQTGDIM